LRSTARKLVDALNLASNRAVTINEVNQLRLDRVHNRYYVEQRFHDFQQGRRFVPLHDVPGGAGDLDARITIEIRKADEPSPDSAEARSSDSFPQQSNPDAITFQPDGTVEAAEILLRDRAGFQLALRLNPTTARVRVVELGRN